MIRVLLVDDHRLVRMGIAAVLRSAGDVEVVAEAENGSVALDLVPSIEVDVVLMDLSMPVMDGVESTRTLLAARPELRIVVLTSFGDQQRVRNALAAGAVGYVLKDCGPDDLVAAVRSAAAGHAPLDPRVATALLPSRDGTSDPVAQLSARELEVLELAATGMANKQIARSLGIAERTVKVHLGNVFRRIGVADRTSAALWARDHLPL